MINNQEMEEQVEMPRPVEEAAIPDPMVTTLRLNFDDATDFN